MANNNWTRRDLVEVLGVLGVIASMIFVGIEIRQNTAAVRGATYQSIADSSLQHVQWWAGNEKLLQLESEIDEGALSEDFAHSENLLIQANIVMTLRRMENIYVQVQEGLVQDDAVLRFRPSHYYFHSAYFQEFWAEYRLEVEPVFRDFFEQEFID